MGSGDQFFGIGAFPVFETRLERIAAFECSASELDGAAPLRQGTTPLRLCRSRNHETISIQSRTRSCERNYAITFCKSSQNTAVSVSALPTPCSLFAG